MIGRSAFLLLSASCSCCMGSFLHTRVGHGMRLRRQGEGGIANDSAANSTSLTNSTSVANSTSVMDIKTEDGMIQQATLEANITKYFNEPLGNGSELTVAQAVHACADNDTPWSHTLAADSAFTKVKAEWNTCGAKIAPGPLKSNCDHMDEASAELSKLEDALGLEASPIRSRVATLVARGRTTRVEGLLIYHLASGVPAAKLKSNLTRELAAVPKTTAEQVHPSITRIVNMAKHLRRVD